MKEDAEKEIEVTYLQHSIENKKSIFDQNEHTEEIKVGETEADSENTKTTMKKSKISKSSLFTALANSQGNKKPPLIKN